MTKKRITVTLDSELDRWIRGLQANLISATQNSWSYSRVLEALVEEGLATRPMRKLKAKNP